MAKSWQVLKMLCPGIEYTINDENDFDSIVWNSGTPAITKTQFEAGFAQYDAWQAEQDAEQAAAKLAAEAKLAALGLTPADLAALGL